MNITVGNLPQNGSKVYPFQFLPAFVNSTIIQGIPYSAIDSLRQFVTTSTNPPTSRRGLPWFDPVLGQLNLGVQCGTTASDLLWMGVAPRQDRVCEAAETLLPRTLCAPFLAVNNRQSVDRVIDTPRTFEQLRLVEYGTSFSGPASAGYAAGTRAGRFQQVQFVAGAATVASGSPCVVTERGLVPLWSNNALTTTTFWNHLVYMKENGGAIVAVLSIHSAQSAALKDVKLVGFSLGAQTSPSHVRCWFMPNGNLFWDP